MEPIVIGNCLEVASQFPAQSIDLIATSPPYACQRNKQYGGIPEKEYPAWTVKWCEAFRSSLKDAGSIAIVIRPHIANGEISDYVLQTRLALRQAQWVEAEELIWIKPAAPPLGHLQRPRRSWESILWFSKTRKPFCDPKANGQESTRIGLETVKGLHDYKNGASAARSGLARCRDYVSVSTSEVDRSPDNTHPAQYPESLARWVVKLLCPKSGTVVDPFVGSGTTVSACERLNQEEQYQLQYYGIEVRADYCEFARSRLARLRQPPDCP